MDLEGFSVMVWPSAKGLLSLYHWYNKLQCFLQLLQRESTVVEEPKERCVCAAVFWPLILINCSGNRVVNCAEGNTQCGHTVSEVKDACGRMYFDRRRCVVRIGCLRGTIEDDLHAGRHPLPELLRCETKIREYCKQRLGFFSVCTEAQHDTSVTLRIRNCVRVGVDSSCLQFLKEISDCGCCIYVEGVCWTLLLCSLFRG